MLCLFDHYILKTPSISSLPMDRKKFHMDNFCPRMLQGDLSSSGNRIFIKV